MELRQSAAALHTAVMVHQERGEVLPSHRGVGSHSVSAEKKAFWSEGNKSITAVCFPL